MVLIPSTKNGFNILFFFSFPLFSLLPTAKCFLSMILLFYSSILLRLQVCFNKLTDWLTYLLQISSSPSICGKNERTRSGMNSRLGLEKPINVPRTHCCQTGKYVNKHISATCWTSQNVPGIAKYSPEVVKKCKGKMRFRREVRLIRLATALNKKMSCRRRWSRPGVCGLASSSHLWSRRRCPMNNKYNRDCRRRSDVKTLVHVKYFQRDGHDTRNRGGQRP